jgi:hypothetical protein
VRSAFTSPPWPASAPAPTAPARSPPPWAAPDRRASPPTRARLIEKGLIYERPATDRILALSEGYPYFLQEYGKHVWNVAAGPTICRASGERLSRLHRVRLSGRMPPNENPHYNVTNAASACVRGAATLRWASAPECSPTRIELHGCLVASRRAGRT